MPSIFLIRKAAQRELSIQIVAKRNIALGTERIEIGRVLPGADRKHDSFETDVERILLGHIWGGEFDRGYVAAIDVNSPDDLIKWSILCRCNLFTDGLPVYILLNRVRHRIQRLIGCRPEIVDAILLDTWEGEGITTGVLKDLITDMFCSPKRE